MYRQRCYIVNEGCKADTKAECFGCGDYVCTNVACSSRVFWYSYGIKRACAHCKKEHDGQYNSKKRRKNTRVTMTGDEKLWLISHLQLLVDINSMEAARKPEVKSILKKLKVK